MPWYKILKGNAFPRVSVTYRDSYIKKKKDSAYFFLVKLLRLLNIKCISIYFEEFLKVNFIQICKYGTPSGNFSFTDRTQGKTTFTKVRVKCLGFHNQWQLTLTFLKYFVKVYTVLQYQFEISYFLKAKNLIYDVLEKQEFDKNWSFISNLKKRKIYLAIKMLKGVVSGFVLSYTTKKKVGDLVVFEKFKVC